MKPLLCVDFDGTIFDGVGIFPGCIARLSQLHAEYRIAIFSARKTEAERTHMKRVLDDNGVPYDEILGVKPDYTYLVDDKAVHFGGDWGEI